jgi:hypothetical protein
MIRIGNTLTFICFFTLLVSFNLQATEVINIKNSGGDMTSQVRNAIENSTDKDLKIVFEKGTYTFLPDYAISKYCFITNHGNGYKRIIFRFENFDSIEIDGNGSEFIFHGQVAPFQFEDCKKITVKNLTMDWDIPFLFQGEVVAVNKEEGYRDIKPLTDGFSWEVKNEHLEFPNIDGFAYAELGNTLAFDPATKQVGYGEFDANSKPTKVEKLKGGILRFYEKQKNYPAIGTMLNSKGPHGENRYAPAFQVTTSKNIHFEGIIIHHALGMGFLFERSEEITIYKCGIYVREGSDRVVSSTADATHFANCKGNVLVEDCRLESMLDDGTNVHGTYVEVDGVIDTHTIRVALKHYEQKGFEFAEAGDAVWFIQNPNPQRGAVNIVTAVKVINDKYSELTFKNAIPSNLDEGDIVENKTWNPVFTMRGCSISKHRARNIIIKTPEKIIIENNDLSSMMSSVMLRGETYYWFESGNVEDVIIRNNRFVHCAYGGASEHAILKVSPRLGKSFDQSVQYDRNIVFENNSIETFDNCIVWADRVDGLIIRGNTIKQTTTEKPLYPDAYMFDLTNCKHVEISKNSYEGNLTKFIKADKITKETLKVKKNKGIK